MNLQKNGENPPLSIRILPQNSRFFKTCNPLRYGVLSIEHHSNREGLNVENMTALISIFARAYHYRNNTEWVFADSLAEKMLTEKEYEEISKSMSKGIDCFVPDFTGSQKTALLFIVDHHLAPSVLARSAFCERAIGNAIQIGCRQIAVFACGYDTFSVRTGNKTLAVFELDKQEMIVNRQNRIEQSGLRPVCQVKYVGCDLSMPSWSSALLKAGFHPGEQSFGSLLGISYYLSKEEFGNLLGGISSIWNEGSAVCFDYPLSEGGMESIRNQELAAAAGEQMKAQYTCTELETLLSETGFLVYEHMNATDASETFFARYNRKNPEHSMTAPSGVGYCLAVKKMISCP